MRYVIDELSEPQYARHRVRLIGYSDSQGAEQYNLELSTKRAEKVSQELGQELRQNGLSVTVADVHGLGSKDPIGDNRTPGGRQRNRRVEIWVLPPP
jgi:outer membrane protein OmpA-like peptidoglycan-associated protein